MSGVVGFLEDQTPTVARAYIEQRYVAPSNRFLGLCDKFLLLSNHSYVAFYLEAVLQGPCNYKGIDARLDPSDRVNHSRVTDLMEWERGQLVSQCKDLVELDAERGILIFSGIRQHSPIKLDICAQGIDKLGNSRHTKCGATLFLSTGVNACREYRQACEDCLCPCGTGCPPIEGTARTRNDPKAVVWVFHGALLFVEAAA